MAATVAATDIGFATILSRKTGSSTYAPLVELTELNLPEESRDSIDFTHFGSPDRYREFKPGLTDPGELSFVYNLVPGLADDLAVKTHFETNMVEGWRVTFPNGATLDYNAFCTSRSKAVPMDDKMTGSATFKVSGKPVLTPGA